MLFVASASTTPGRVWGPGGRRRARARPQIVRCGMCAHFRTNGTEKACRAAVKPAARSILVPDLVPLGTVVEPWGEIIGVAFCDDQRSYLIRDPDGIAELIPEDQVQARLAEEIDP